MWPLLFLVASEKGSVRSRRNKHASAVTVSIVVRHDTPVPERAHMHFTLFLLVSRKLAAVDLTLRCVTLPEATSGLVQVRRAGLQIHVGLGLR